MLPLEFESTFKALGLNPNDPRLGAWWDAKEHLEKAKEYNKRWADFLSEKRSRQEILDYARQLANQYGLDIAF